MRSALTLLGAFVVAPIEAHARRSKTPPPPEAWSYSVEATRTVVTKAVGEGAVGMPEGLQQPHTDSMRWTATAGIDQVYPDGSVSELLRVSGLGTPMDGRVFGLRRFDDGEVLRVERLLDLADTGLAAWDPILVGLSPARPESVSVRAPGKRALQWTARVGTARFLRSNCPATWTLIDDGGTEVAGWLGRPVEHLRYTARCSLNGRADRANGGPVPLRGNGDMKGEVWWDAETHQILRHEFTLERAVESRWMTSKGGISLTQDQSFAVRVEWSPAAQKPMPVRPLATTSVLELLPKLGHAWGRCASGPGPVEVVLVAAPADAIEIEAVRPPSDPSSATPVAVARPGLVAAPDHEAGNTTAVDIGCWQEVADAFSLPPHDEDGLRFSFVLPRNGDGYGAPGVVDRQRPTPGALFLAVPSGLEEPCERWLEVR